MFIFFMRSKASARLLKPAPGQQQRSHQPAVAGPDDDDVGTDLGAWLREAAGDGYPALTSARPSGPIGQSSQQGV